MVDSFIHGNNYSKNSFILISSKIYSNSTDFRSFLVRTFNNKLKSLKVAKLKDENGGSDGGDEGCDKCFDERSYDR